MQYLCRHEYYHQWYYTHDYHYYHCYVLIYASYAAALGTRVHDMTHAFQDGWAPTPALTPGRPGLCFFYVRLVSYASFGLPRVLF